MAEHRGFGQGGSNLTQSNQWKSWKYSSKTVFREDAIKQYVLILGYKWQLAKRKLYLWTKIKVDDP